MSEHFEDASKMFVNWNEFETRRIIVVAEETNH